MLGADQGGAASRSPSATATSAARRSRTSEDDIDIEDLIADQQMVISITHSGYIKSLPLATYRQQRRGGVGRDRDGHEGRRLHRAPLRVLDARLPPVLHQPRQGLPLEGLRAARGRRAPSKGRASVNLLPLREGERVQSVLATRDFSRGRVPRLRDPQGPVKKTEFQAYNTPIKADGIIAINIRDDDELVAVRRVERGRRDPHGLALRPGRALQREQDARAMGRDTSGVRGMDVAGKDNYVLAMDVARDDQELLVVTENGYGKRTRDRRVPARGRGARASRRSRSPRRRAGSPARWSCASTRSSCSSRRTAWCSAPRVRGINRYGRASRACG